LAKQEKHVTVYVTKINPIRGRSNRAVVREANRYYRELLKHCSGLKGKRRPAVKSKSLKNAKGQKRKIFLDRFKWHLKDKNITDVARRLKLLPCVKELLENSKLKPRKEGNTYKFTGVTPGGEIFTVIVREGKKELQLLTFYPDRQ